MSMSLPLPCRCWLSLPQVFYNPSEVTFEALCGVFLGRIDPTQVNGQGGDRGTQYRTGIYPHTKDQEEVVRAPSLLPPPTFLVFFSRFSLSCRAWAWKGSSCEVHMYVRLCKLFCLSSSCSCFFLWNIVGCACVRCCPLFLPLAVRIPLAVLS